MANRTETFLTLYNREQRRIYAYIRTLLARPEDAEEVFQEVCIAMWRSFDQFEPGTNFTAWSRSIARYRVLAFCKQRRRDPLMLSPEAMEAVTVEIERDEEVVSARRVALDSCLESLPSTDREIIAQKYRHKTTTVEVAQRLGRPLNTVYKALKRIRRVLSACIEKKLATESRR